MKEVVFNPELSGAILELLYMETLVMRYPSSRSAKEWYAKAVDKAMSFAYMHTEDFDIHYDFAVIRRRVKRKYGTDAEYQAFSRYTYLKDGKLYISPTCVRKSRDLTTREEAV